MLKDVMKGGKTMASKSVVLLVKFHLCITNMNIKEAYQVSKLKVSIRVHDLKVQEQNNGSRFFILGY